MNSNKQRYYLTTAIAYASAKPHFGNTYEIIFADAVARYKRAMGYDVFLCTGTDEHGQKIEDKAKAAGVTPKEYVDGVASVIKGVWDSMDTSYDYFIRTTDDYHVSAVAKIFKRFFDQGDIYKGKYEGWYCKPCESFYTDTQIVDGKCPDCGAPVEKAEEEAYFFKMSKYADRLIEYIETHPGFIEPEARKKEMLNNFLKVEGGLHDLCVSRTSFTWGIGTFDPRHVIYVWLDALTNYITAIGYDPEKSYEEQSDYFKRSWPCDVHIIGKDIVRFHTIYWPIFLMALDLPLPKKVFGHPWFLFGEEKMSKSKGNVIYNDSLAERIGSVDGVRYYALAEMPYANDGSVTYDQIIPRFNNDLVNNLGNLVKRTLDMNKKYFDGTVQKPTAREELDDDLYSVLDRTFADYKKNMDDFRISDAAENIFALLSRANKYIDETTPWSLAKDDSKRERLGTVLYNLLDVIRSAAILLMPFTPQTSLEILKEINAKPELDAYAAGAKEVGRENAGYVLFDGFVKKDGLVPGTVNNPSTVLFARIDEKKMLEEIQAEREAAKKAKEAEEKAKIKPEGCAMIAFDDFMKVEIRTAQVIAAEPVPKAKKLLKLIVDLGYEQRQVVSGIAKFYKPEDLIGKKLAVVANLAPAVLCGIESQGMILASGEETIRVLFLSDDTPLGERIR